MNAIKNISFSNTGNKKKTMERAETVKIALILLRIQAEVFKKKRS